MPVASVHGVRVSDEVPAPGWGRLGKNIRWSDKAGYFDYHGRSLWIAKANMVLGDDGAYYAKVFAIRSAKAWADQTNSRE